MQKKLDWVKELAAGKIEEITEVARNLQEKVELEQERVKMTRCEMESWAAEQGCSQFNAAEGEVSDLPTAIRRIERAETVRKQTVRKLERAETSISELQQELNSKTHQMETFSQRVSAQESLVETCKTALVQLVTAVEGEKEAVLDLERALKGNKVEEIERLVGNLARKIGENGPKNEGNEQEKPQISSRFVSKESSPVSSPRKSHKTLRFSQDSDSSPSISTGKQSVSPLRNRLLQAAVAGREDANSDKSSESSRPASKLTVDTSKPLEMTTFQGLDSPKSAPVSNSSGFAGKNKEKIHIRGVGIRRNEETQMSRSFLHPVIESPENQFLTSLKGLFGRYLSNLQTENSVKMELEEKIEGLGVEEMMNLEVEIGEKQVKLGHLVVKNLENALIPVILPIKSPPKRFFSPQKDRDLRVEVESIKDISTQERLFSALIEDYNRMMEVEARRKGIKKLSNFSEKAVFLGNLLETRVNEGENDEISVYLRHQPGKSEYNNTKQTLISLILTENVEELTAKIRRLPIKTPKQRIKQVKIAGKWLEMSEKAKSRRAKYLGRGVSLQDSQEVWYLLATHVKYVKHRLLGIHSRLRSLASLSDTQEITVNVPNLPMEPQTTRVLEPKFSRTTIKRSARVHTFDEAHLQRLLPALSSGGLNWSGWK